MEVVVAEVDLEAVAGLLETLAEFTSTPSQEVYPLKRASATKRRGFASNATRRDTMSSNARSSKARKRSTLCRSINDDGKAALETNWSSRLHMLVILRHC
jgi:hypothetical protein